MIGESGGIPPTRPTTPPTPPASGSSPDRDADGALIPSRRRDKKRKKKKEEKRQPAPDANEKPDESDEGGQHVDIRVSGVQIARAL